ncbi:MAG TPA: hypothetical protein VM681_11095 [Candidatus Thermoplasmatota archaeon]|nr:hypothetical protein [Candidatus Thermoplasmatota archaeon]
MVVGHARRRKSKLSRVGGIFTRTPATILALAILLPGLAAADAVDDTRETLGGVERDARDLADRIAEDAIEEARCLLRAPPLATHQGANARAQGASGRAFAAAELAYDAATRHAVDAATDPLGLAADPDARAAQADADATSTYQALDPGQAALALEAPWIDHAAADWNAARHWAIQGVVLGQDAPERALCRAPQAIQEARNNTRSHVEEALEDPPSTPTASSAAGPLPVPGFGSGGDPNNGMVNQTVCPRVPLQLACAVARDVDRILYCAVNMTETFPGQAAGFVEDRVEEAQGDLHSIKCQMQRHAVNLSWIAVGLAFDAAFVAVDVAFDAAFLVVDVALDAAFCAIDVAFLKPGCATAMPGQLFGAASGVAGRAASCTLDVVDQVPGFPAILQPPTQTPNVRCYESVVG